MHGRVRCFVCGQFGAGFEDPTVRKCSLGVCGRFYHIKYALQSACFLQYSRALSFSMLVNMCVVV